MPWCGEGAEGAQCCGEANTELSQREGGENFLLQSRHGGVSGQQSLMGELWCSPGSWASGRLPSESAPWRERWQGTAGGLLAEES